MPYHLASMPRPWLWVTIAEKSKLQRHVSHSIGIQFRLKNNHSRRISSVGSVVYSNKQTNTMKIMPLHISLVSYFHDIYVLIGNHIHMTVYIRLGIQASILCKHKAWTGFEPMIFSLRDKHLTTWPTCPEPEGLSWLRKERILQRNVCFSYIQFPLKNNLNRAICSVVCSNEQTTIESVSFKNLAQMGVEPMIFGFWNLRLPTWAPKQRLQAVLRLQEKGNCKDMFVITKVFNSHVKTTKAE